MTRAESLAQYVLNLQSSDLSDEVREKLRDSLIDAFGCALQAIGSGPIHAVREQVEEFGASGPVTLIGGGTSTPPLAAFHNTALIRYVDFMDNFLGKSQSGHPSDTIAPVLAAAEYAGASGEDFMLAVATAYEVFCTLLEEFPVQEQGFDHTVQLAIAEAAGCAKLLGLSLPQTANAIAIAANSVQGLVEVRSDYLSEWKGLASAMTAMDALFATFLAKRGITGPDRVFEGVRGLEQITGRKLNVDWSRHQFKNIRRVSIKTYNSEVHSQSAIEGMLELVAEHKFTPDDVDKIEVEIFRQADNIIGTGSEAGHKKRVYTKEQADHSLFYLLAVAILDGEVTPRQFTPERIMQPDVQQLLQKIEVGRKSNIGLLDSYTNAYPDDVRCKLTVSLKSGKTLVCEKKDFYGFFKRPMSRDDVVAKFRTLAEGRASSELQDEILDCLMTLERRTVKQLCELLGKARGG